MNKKRIMILATTFITPQVISDLEKIDKVKKEVDETCRKAIDNDFIDKKKNKNKPKWQR